MLFPIASIERVVADNIGHDFARQISAAWVAIRPAGDAVAVGGDRLGVLLAEALASGQGEAMAAVELVGVEITAGAFHVALDAQDSASHPLLRSWLPLNLGDAIAAPMVRAASMAALAPGQPTQRSVDVLERGDFPPRGLASFDVETALGVARVVAYYGAGEDPAHVSSHRLNGPALSVAGWSLLSTDRSSLSPVSFPDAGLHAAPPASSTRH